MYAKMLMTADGSKVAEQMFLYARVLAGTPMIPPAQSSQPSASGQSLGGGWPPGSAAR